MHTTLDPIAPETPEWALGYSDDTIIQAWLAASRLAQIGCAVFDNAELARALANENALFNEMQRRGLI